MGRDRALLDDMIEAAASIGAIVSETNYPGLLSEQAWLGPPADRLFGDYLMKVHPEYYDENPVFEAGTFYSFTVVFDTGGR